MSEYCDACGQPVGHADEIVKEYVELNGIKVFGSSECQRIFEEDKEVEPAQECDACHDPVKEKNMENLELENSSGLTLQYKVHPDCVEDMKDRRM